MQARMWCSATTGSFTLDGNVPSVGTGAWSVFSGTATIDDPASPASAVSGVPAGTSATLRWTITNGGCTPSTDDVVLTNVSTPAVDARFNGQDAPTICAGGSGTLSANPTGGGACTGGFEYAWYTGDGTDDTYWNGSTWDNAETWGAYATIPGIAPEVNTTYKVKVRCSSLPLCSTVDGDGVAVTLDLPPTTADAGPDQQQCGNGSFTLAANAPSQGSGAWSVVSGTASIASAASPTSGVTGVPVGTSATLRWTISNGVCPSSTDDVVLTNYALPAVPTITPAAPAICIGGSVGLAATPTVALTAPYTGGALSRNGTGIWAPYPSTASVSGLPVTGARVKRVNINGFNGVLGNLDLVLRSPTGINVILIGDAGSISSGSGLNYVLEDGAPAITAFSSSGTYRPTNSGTQNWPSPGPGSLNQALPTLASFTGNLNGNWELFAINDFGSNNSITSWSITFEVDLGFAWSPADGLSATNVSNPTASPGSTTTYTVTVTNPVGGCSSQNTVQVTVNPLPVMDCPEDLSVCSNDAPFALAGGTPSGGTYSGIGVSSGVFDPAVAGAGDHLITYTYTDVNTCTNTCTFMINVKAAPVVDAGSYGPVCMDADVVELEGSPVGGTWSGTGVAGNVDDGFVFDPVVGTQSLTYSYTAPNGCSDTDGATIIVNPVPVADPISDVTLCNGTTSAAIVLTGPDATSFSWTNTNPSIGLAADGAGDIPSFEASGGALSAISGTIEVTPYHTSNSLTCTGTAVSFSITVVPCTDLNVKAFLEGPFDGVRMSDGLRNGELLPTSHPYSGFGHSGTESVVAAVFEEDDQDDAIVDWVLLELRPAASPATVLHRRAALIQRDGDVVDLDGTSQVRFIAVFEGEYHVAIRHRNHLGAMTADVVALSNSPVGWTSPPVQLATYGTNATKQPLSGSARALERQRQPQRPPALHQRGQRPRCHPGIHHRQHHDNPRGGDLGGEQRVCHGGLQHGWHGEVCQRQQRP
jgi:hypothetical protein